MTERTRTLNKLSDELEQVKKEMDERGSSMTDGSKSLKALKSFVITPLIIKIIYSASDKHKKNNHKIEIRDIRNEREDRCLRVHTYVHENS